MCSLKHSRVETNVINVLSDSLIGYFNASQFPLSDRSLKQRLQHLSMNKTDQELNIKKNDKINIFIIQ